MTDTKTYRYTHENCPDCKRVRGVNVGIPCSDCGHVITQAMMDEAMVAYAERHWAEMPARIADFKKHIEKDEQVAAEAATNVEHSKKRLAQMELEYSEHQRKSQ